MILRVARHRHARLCIGVTLWKCSVESWLGNLLGKKDRRVLLCVHIHHTQAFSDRGVLVDPAFSVPGNLVDRLDILADLLPAPSSGNLGWEAVGRPTAGQVLGSTWSAGNNIY